MKFSKGKVTVSFKESYRDSGDEKLLLDVLIDSLPVDQGLIRTQVFAKEDSATQKKLLMKAAEILLPYTEDAVVSEGRVFLKDPEILEKMTWFGVEFLEEY